MDLGSLPVVLVLASETLLLEALENLKDRLCWLGEHRLNRNSRLQAANLVELVERGSQPAFNYRVVVWQLAVGLLDDLNAQSQLLVEGRFLEVVALVEGKSVRGEVLQLSFGYFRGLFVVKLLLREEEGVSNRNQDGRLRQANSELSLEATNQELCLDGRAPHEESLDVLDFLGLRASARCSGNFPVRREDLQDVEGFGLLGEGKGALWGECRWGERVSE